jgi:hypothetical protein
MDFYIVFCKVKKKFDKYVKVNKIKNKVIIDIKGQIEENQINNIDKYKDYFNLLIYTKIIQSLKKNKDIYYIPDFSNNFSMNEIINMKSHIDENINFNILIFFDDFGKNDENLKIILNNLDIFDYSQIIKDY